MCGSRKEASQVLVDFLDNHEDVAGIAPAYLNPDGTEQQHHYRLPTYRMLLSSAIAGLRNIPPFSRWVRSYRMLDDDFTRARRVEQPSASCLLLRRSCLPRDHLLDEQYPIYFNDVALARRLAEQGEELWMTPDARVVHELGASGRQLGGIQKRHHLAGLVRYLKETERGALVALFQVLVLAQGIGARIFRPRTALSVSDLLSAVAGDPGPLPHAALAPHARAEHAETLSTRSTFRSVAGESRSGREIMFRTTSSVLILDHFRVPYEPASDPDDVGSLARAGVRSLERVSPAGREHGDLLAQVRRAKAVRDLGGSARARCGDSWCPTRSVRHGYVRRRPHGGRRCS